MNRLLLVDNDAAVCECLCECLASDFEVEVAGSKQGAMEALRRQRPDVLLVDESLGDGRGTEILEQLQGSESRPAVVVFSVGMNEQLSKRARSLGAAGCLAKPFSIDELRETLYGALHA